MEQAITYRLTKGIQRTKERYRLLSILLPVLLIGFLFLNPATKDADLLTKAGIGLFVFVLLGLIFYFTTSRVIRGLAELSISILPEGLKRESRHHSEIFLWQDVQAVEIRDYPNAGTATINLTFSNKKVITLFGLDDMETAVKQIEAVLPREISMRRQRLRVNWDQPVTLAVTLVLGFLITSAVILTIQLLGERAYLFFNVFLCFLFGLYNLRFKPISRAQGKGWQTFEMAIGVSLVAGAVLLLGFGLILLP